MIQRIEEDKKENDDFSKLRALVSRINGFPNSVFHAKRKLLYEGYLTLVPFSFHAPLMRMNTPFAGGTPYIYAPHPNVIPRRNTSLSLGRIASRKILLYVFLFDDIILLCTKVAIYSLMQKCRNVTELVLLHCFIKTGPIKREACRKECQSR